jgi:probable rRNA maturation factor
MQHMKKIMVQKTMVQKRSNIDLDYQICLSSDECEVCFTPELKKIISWIRVALQEIEYHDNVQLTLRVVTEKEMIDLNGTYRQKWVSTNVLAFPFEPLSGVTVALIGDVVICASVVQQQAIEQDKTYEQHWAHMVVHATLHLLGFDHDTEDGTEKMESVEKAILLKFDYPDPYAELSKNGCI